MSTEEILENIRLGDFIFASRLRRLHKGGFSEDTDWENAFIDGIKNSVEKGKFGRILTGMRLHEKMFNKKIPDSYIMRGFAEAIIEDISNPYNNYGNFDEAIRIIKSYETRFNKKLSDGRLEEELLNSVVNVVDDGRFGIADTGAKLYVQLTGNNPSKGRLEKSFWEGLLHDIRYGLMDQYDTSIKFYDTWINDNKKWAKKLENAFWHSLFTGTIGDGYFKLFCDSARLYDKFSDKKFQEEFPKKASRVNLEDAFIKGIIDSVGDEGSQELVDEGIKLYTQLTDKELPRDRLEPPLRDIIEHLLEEKIHHYEDPTGDQDYFHSTGFLLKLG